jgi:ATP-dependent DNA ligase
MVLDAVKQLELRSTILDGEIVALDAETEEMPSSAFFPFREVRRR